VVTSAKVPVRVRNILNLESGLNDGLALPFVLLFLELSTGEAGSVLEATGSLGLETVLGLAAGVVLALAAGGLLGRLPDCALERCLEGLYALGLGLLAFGGADLVGGNGLIAAFCAGVALAVTRNEMPEVFQEFNESLGSVLQIAAFTILASTVAHGLTDTVGARWVERRMPHG